MRKLLWLVLLLLACGADDTFEPMPAIDSTCAEVLCGWDVVEGALTPSASWHEHQRAVLLAGQPTVISKSYPFVQHVDCLSFEFLADVEAQAELSVELDFNDDGVIDASTDVPPVRWRKLELGLRTPPDYRALRIVLRKQGVGDARIASLVIDNHLETCATAKPTTLADGSACSTDSTCSSGRCLLGKCESCGPGGCGEGEACRSSDECRDGACAAGVCRACAKQGSCPVNTGCSVGGQCASGSCGVGARPGETAYPGLDGVCGDCRSDVDCGGGFCVLGRCGACRQDDDCSAGQVCRYADLFDVTTRSCAAPVTSALPRGALCETSADCAAGLQCGGSAGRAARCGVACVSDGDCEKQNGVCATSGATRVVDPPAKLALLPAWSSAPGRIATCYPRSGGACEVQEQCTESLMVGGFTLPGMPLACCAGKCTHASLDPTTNRCVGGDSLPSN